MRKHRRITQLQELNSYNATRQRQPAQTWQQYLAQHPDFTERTRSTRTNKIAAVETSDDSTLQETYKHETHQ